MAPSPAGAKRSVAIVTGGARGIGLAISSELAQTGYDVLIVDIDGGGQQVADELDSTGPSIVKFVRADMRDTTAISRVFAEARDSFETIDVLVNNAAVTRVIDFFDVTPDDWNRLMEINARGYFFAMQEAAKWMRETGGGSIVNVASIAGKGWRETSNIAYAASKGGIITMSRIAASQLGRFGIRVNSVCPGMTRTDIWSGWIEGRSAAEGRPVPEILAEMTAGVSTGELNDPIDIARAVGFLASDSARNITGQSLNVDGGTVWD